MSNLTFQQRKEIYKMERRARSANEIRVYVCVLMICYMCVMNLGRINNYGDALLAISLLHFICIIRDKVVPSIYDTPRPDVG